MSLPNSKIPVLTPSQASEAAKIAANLRVFFSIKPQQPVKQQNG